MADTLQAGIVNSAQLRKRDRKQTVGRGWLLVIPRRSGMEKGQGLTVGRGWLLVIPNRSGMEKGRG
jgi:hypothetical protein